jgi:putative flippase GtrA
MKLSIATKRYLAVGIFVYVLELVVIVVAGASGVQPTWAVGLSFWVGLLVSFVLQKFVTFGDRRIHHKVLTKQITVYALLVLFNFGFTLLVTALLTPMFPAILTRSAALAITSFWNFFLYKTKIFNAYDNPVY